MSFIELLKTKHDVKQEQIVESVLVTEQKEKAEEVLRDAGYKIKLVTPTSFGTQIDFAKKYDEEEIQNVLKSFTIKIKNKSVFIVD